MSAQARAKNLKARAREELEVDVPEPADVRAVGEEVVDGDHEQRLGLGLGARSARTGPEHCLEHLIEADGILDEVQQNLPVPECDMLLSTEDRLKRLETRDDVARAYAERAANGGRRDRVVGVVDADKRERHRQLIAVGSNREISPPILPLQQPSDRHIGLWAAPAAAAARVVADVAVVRPGIPDARAAPMAEPLVGFVRQLG